MTIESIEQLDDMLSQPSQGVIETLGRLEGLCVYARAPMRSASSIWADVPMMTNSSPSRITKSA